MVTIHCNGYKRSWTRWVVAIFLCNLGVDQVRCSTLLRYISVFSGWYNRCPVMIIKKNWGWPQQIDVGPKNKKGHFGQSGPRNGPPSGRFRKKKPGRRTKKSSPTLLWGYCLPVTRAGQYDNLFGQLARWVVPSSILYSLESFRSHKRVNEKNVSLPSSFHLVQRQRLDNDLLHMISTLKCFRKSQGLIPTPSPFI